jgi:serine/threonine protein kinase
MAHVCVGGKYVLVRKLGAGAMGAVYEGRHIELGKRLAIKVIHPEYCASPAVVTRFRREARAASAAQSDYIVETYDLGLDDAFGLYMIMEYLEGEDLDARLSRERWIDTREATAIGVQVARGLARAHAAGVIHRDLKPANIFLTPREDGVLHAKILDFGISKLEGGQGTDAAEPTLAGITLGTPQYMSPEQCEGDSTLDGRTDVWSLCAVLYEMIAGAPAVGLEGGYVAIMRRIILEDIVPLEKRAPWVEGDVARVIDEGLVRDRDRRLPDAVTLATRLAEALPEAGSFPSIPTIRCPPSSTFADAATMAEVPERPSLPSRRHASSMAPASGEAEAVGIFARGDMLRELATLRSRK